MLSFHTPLNITLSTMAPLGWILNGKTIEEQWINLQMIINRIPIFIVDIKGNIYCTKFTALLNEIPDIIKAFFDTDIQNQTKTIQNIKNILLKAIGYKEQNNIARNNITENLKETDFEIYSSCYSNGQYSGITSPQANDYFTSPDLKLESNSGNSNPIKCIFQIALLANVYGISSMYYTLTSGGIIITETQNGDIKYTGKYWTDLISKDEDDENPENIKTTDLCERVWNYMANKKSIKESIENEIGIKISTIEQFDNKKSCFMWCKNEYEINKNINKELNLQARFACRLFVSALGLEDFLKQNLALTISGILGHSWDKLLRFFDVTKTEKNIEKEWNIISNNYPNMVFIKHLGTPIASYLYDFKKGEQTGLLGGYNAYNFSKTINEKIISIRDKINKPTTYNPQDIPNCLIPITYNNAILECTTKCYRSYRKLLKLMKTRKQRNYLFDRLSSYGRRAMTVLDPYGIFMHFHNDTKGLQPS